MTCRWSSYTVSPMTPRLGRRLAEARYVRDGEPDCRRAYRSRSFGCLHSRIGGRGGGVDADRPCTRRPGASGTGSRTKRLGRPRASRRAAEPSCAWPGNRDRRGYGDVDALEPDCYLFVVCVRVCCDDQPDLNRPGRIPRSACDSRLGRVVAVDGRLTSDRERIETLVTLEAESYLKGALGPTCRFSSRVNKPAATARSWSGRRSSWSASGSSCSSALADPPFPTSSVSAKVCSASACATMSRWSRRRRCWRCPATRGDPARQPMRLDGVHPGGARSREAFSETGQSRALIAALAGARATRPRNEVRRHGRRPRDNAQVESNTGRIFRHHRAVPGVDTNQFSAAMIRAFATWEALPTAAIGYQFIGFTFAEPGDDDGMSTLGFQAAPGARSCSRLPVFSSTASPASCSSRHSSSYELRMVSGGRSDRFDLRKHRGSRDQSSQQARPLDDQRDGTGGERWRRVVAAKRCYFPSRLQGGQISARTLRR